MAKSLSKVTYPYIICFQLLEDMIKDLRKLNSPFAARLTLQVELRVNERRLKVPATLLGYLENPSFLKEKNRVLPSASKTEIAELMRDLYLRLFIEKKPDENEGQNPPVEDPEFADDEEMPPPPKRSRSNEKREQLKEKRTRDMTMTKNEPEATCVTPASLLTALKNNMKEYEVEKKRPEKLQQVRY